MDTSLSPGKSAKRVIDKVPDILLAQLAAFSLACAVVRPLNLNYPAGYIAGLVILCIILMHIVFYNRKTTISAFALAGASIAGGAAYMLAESGFEELCAFIEEYYYWLKDYVYYPDTPQPAFQYVTALAICIIASVFAYLCVVVHFNFLLLTAAGMSIFAALWIYGIATELGPFYLFLAAVLVSYFKYIYIIKFSGEPNEYAGNASMALWSLPLCMLAIVVASSFHASDKPIEWKWLDQKIISIYNYLKRNFDYETFEYFSLAASSGFGDSGGILGGRVRLDRTTVLRVATEKRIYLRGAARDEYDGKNWTAGKTVARVDNDFGVLYDDCREMFSGMEILAGNDDFLLDDYFESNKVTVTYRNIKTKSLFIPAGTIKFAPVSAGFSGFISDTGDLSSEKRLTKGFKYELEMYRPKLGEKDFEDLIRKSRKGLYEEHLYGLVFSGGTTVTEKRSLSGNFPEKRNRQPQILSPFDNENTESESGYATAWNLRKKSRQIYDRYLALPETLPQRVKDLALSLTGDKQNNYDKAKAIEQYLAANYPYNLDVRSTPRNRDFVDYFLFDLKEGYCSYFATAMTVLARCAGLPARYVEGYILPPEPLKDNPGIFMVTNMQAHAWVEIYFEGYGWLPFEPTPPFRPDFYKKSYPDVQYGEYYDSAYQDYMEMMKMYASQGGAAYNFPGEAGGGGFPDTMTVILIAAGVLTAAVFVLPLANAARRKLFLFKLVNLPAKESITRFYGYYLKVLGLSGLGIKPSETPFQYSSRVDSLFYFGTVRFKTITDVFVKARYGPDDPPESEKLLLHGFCPVLMKVVRNDIGRFKYFALKYLLGKF